MGLLIALIPSICFGLNGLLLIRIGGNLRQQFAGQALGALSVGLIMFPFLPAQYTSFGVFIAFLSGVILAVSISFQLDGFKQIGVSGVMPITTGLQLVFISLAGVIFFGEWATRKSLTIGLIALLLLVIGSALTAWRQRDGESSIPVMQFRKGLVMTLLCTVGFVIYPLIVRWYNVDGFAVFLPQTVGLAVTATLLNLRPPRRDEDGDLTEEYAIDNGVCYNGRTLKLFIPGILWGTGVMLMMYSNATVGVATGFTLSQLGVIISTFGGIFWLGETRTRKEISAVSLGVVLLVIGAILIGVAKTYDLPV